MTLPEGWLESCFEEAVTVVRGVTFSKEQRAEVPTEGYVPCLRSGNVQDELTTEKLIHVPDEVVKSPDRYVRDGDAIVSMSNSYELVGKVARADARHEGMTFGAFLSSFRSDVFDSGYLFNLLRSMPIQSAMRATASQTVNISNLSIGGMADIVLPLPPAPEQRRIVAKLDALTAHLARARAELDRVPVLARRLKDAALADAFTKNVGARATLDALTDDAAPIRYGVLQPGTEKNVGVQLIRVCDLERMRVAWSELRRIAPEIDRQFAKARVQDGDILISVVGTIGRVALVEGLSEPANIARAVARLRPDTSRVLPAWLTYRLISPDCQKVFAGDAREVARKTLNVSFIKAMEITLPSLHDQIGTVRTLDAAFARADRMEAEATRARALVDRLEAAILARAFCGELVPQDPADERASVLLDRIRARRAEAPRPKRGRRAAAG